MSETAVQSARIDPSENLDAWLDKKIARDAEPEAETGQSDAPDSPAQPTVTDSVQSAQPDWREQVLPEDVPHGFFRGKKVGDLFESYTHAERAKQDAERQRNEIQRELEQLRREREAEAAARRVLTEQQPAAQAPTTDEIEAAWFENPARAKALLMQQAEERARNAVREELGRAQEANQAEQRVQYAQQAAAHAVQRVADAYGIDEQAAQRRVMGTFALMSAHEQANNDPSVWLNPEAYLYFAEQISGGPPPPASYPAPTPAPELPDPPGSKRSAPPASRVSQPSALRAETEDAYRALAAVVGADPDRVIARRTARRGGSRV